MPRVETVASVAASRRMPRNVNAPGELGGPATPADCRSCGACCFSPAETFVRVTGADWARLGDLAETVAQFIGHRAFMRMRGGHCVALALRTDAAGNRDFFCTIYERRPQICRDLARGSPECLGEIATKPNNLREKKIAPASSVARSA